MPATDDQQTGIIYILKHKSGTTVKVGKTLVSASARHADYTRRYDLKGFTLFREFGVPSSSLNSIEKQAHRLLSDYKLSGIEGARELFSCGTNVAVRAVEKAISEDDEVQRRDTKERADAEHRRKLRDGFERVWPKSPEFEQYRRLMIEAEKAGEETISLDTFEGREILVSLIALGVFGAFYVWIKTQDVLQFLILLLAVCLLGIFLLSLNADKRKDILQAKVDKAVEKILQTKKNAETIKTQFAIKYYHERRHF